MKDKKQDTTKPESNQSNPNTSTLTPGEISWRKFQEMPYDTSRKGKAFIMSSPMRPIGKKDSKPGKGLEDGTEPTL